MSERDVDLIGARDPWALAAAVEGAEIDWAALDDPTAELERRLGARWEDLMNPDDLSLPVYGLEGLGFEPFLVTEPSAMRWESVTLPSSEQVDWSRVMQGHAMDCYLLAPMMALAWSRRFDALRVLPHERGAEVHTHLGPLVCSTEVPTDGVRVPRFARDGWVAMREKGWLVARGGAPDRPSYASLQSMGFASQALAWHVGSTGTAAGLTENMRNLLGAGPLAWPCVTWTNARASAAGLAPRHAYAVLGVFGDGLVLADPWAFADRDRAPPAARALIDAARADSTWGRVLEQRYSVTLTTLELAAEALQGFAFVEPGKDS